MQALETTIAADTEDSRALARHWNALLYGAEPGRLRISMNDDRRSTWLRAFVADNPEWDQRLDAWIEYALITHEAEKGTRSDTA